MHRHCGSQTIRNSKNGTIVGHKEEKQHEYNAKVGKSNKQQEEQERKWKRMALHGCAIPGKDREDLNLPAVLVFLRRVKYNGLRNETIKTEQLSGEPVFPYSYMELISRQYV